MSSPLAADDQTVLFTLNSTPFRSIDRTRLALTFLYMTSPVIDSYLFVTVLTDFVQRGLCHWFNLVEKAF